MEKEARKKKSLRWYGREIRKNRDNYLMVAPYAVIFTVFTVIPVVLAIVMSFTYFNLLEPPQFRGLFNYMRLFLDDDVFWLSMKNTLIFALLTGPLSYFLCLVLTNFVSNTVAMILFFSICIPALAGTSVSTVAVTITLCIIANFASLVPSAAVTAPLFFGDGHITVKNALKWNLVMIGLAFLVSIFIVYPLGNLLL